MSEVRRWTVRYRAHNRRARPETHILKGASLKDPSGLFNSSLEGNTRRAIDFHEDDDIDEQAFATLIRAAVSLNESSARR